MNLSPRISPLVALVFLGLLLTLPSCGLQQHQGVTVIVAFPSFADLKQGFPIEYNGTRVGSVGKVELTDEGIRAELLLNPDAAITRAMLPVASPNYATVRAPSVVFWPGSASDLASIYGKDTTMIESDYQDGDFVAIGLAFDPSELREYMIQSGR